jgi:hypothetical protein
MTETVTDSGPHIVLAKQLNEIANSMLQTGDLECDHSNADKALLHALYLLAESRTPEIRDATKRIVQMFGGLDKWYA